LLERAALRIRLTRSSLWRAAVLASYEKNFPLKTLEPVFKEVEDARKEAEKGRGPAKKAKKAAKKAEGKPEEKEEKAEEPGAAATARVLHRLKGR
jgi:hypothetical protein